MQRTRRICLFVLCLFLLAVCLGCGANKQQAAVKNDVPAFAVLQDDLGRTVTLAAKPQRIVVLSASFLEPLHEVGGDVVGRPDSRTFMPAYAKDKMSVGQVYNIDLEKVLACAPDLVIVNKGMNEKLLPSLETNKIPAVVVDMKSYADVKREVHLFAQITGEPEKGKALVQQMDDRIQAVKDKLPQQKRRVAILHSTAQGLSVQLDGSIAGSVANMLGFTNVASGMTALENNPDAAPYSIETLVEQDPEILFITSMGKMEDIKKSMQATIRDNPAWKTIPAIKNDKMFYLSQDLFLLSPGLHYPEAVEEMAKLIYPEAF